jgi:hypothetical protein
LILRKRFSRFRFYPFTRAFLDLDPSRIGLGEIQIQYTSWQAGMIGLLESTLRAGLQREELRLAWRSQEDLPLVQDLDRQLSSGKICRVDRQNGVRIPAPAAILACEDLNPGVFGIGNGDWQVTLPLGFK